MKSISLLMTDVRMAAPGCPDILITHALTRSLAQFLDFSEAWREWGPARTVADLSNNDVHGSGASTLTWPNHLDESTQRWLHVKRLLELKWVPTGKAVAFKTPAQLQAWDTDWRNTTGSVPMFWTPESEGDSGEIAVRIYPVIDSVVDTTYQFLPRFVVGTEVVAGAGMTAYDDQIPNIPDRIFNAYREGIVAGALAKLYMIPGRDWSNPTLVAPYAQAFSAASADAKARAEREFGHTDSLVQYGGY